MSYSVAVLERMRVDFPTPLDITQAWQQLGESLQQGWIPERFRWQSETTHISVLGVECVRASVRESRN